MVLTGLVLIVMVYSTVQSAVQQQTIQLLLHIISILFALYSLAIIHKYCDSVKKSTREQKSQRCCSVHDEILYDPPPEYSSTLPKKMPMEITGLGIKT